MQSMMKLKASHAITTAAVVIGFAAMSVGSIYAATTTPDSKHPGSELVAAIAKKFNLNQSDVQQVFDDQRAQMESQQEKNNQDRLAKAVSSGKLTQQQADAITAKEQEMKSFVESLKGKTAQERQTAMKSQMDSLKKWVTDNKIPAQFVPFDGPRMGRGHMEHGFPRGPKPIR